MAYADRFQYLADPEFTDVPWNGLISDEYSKIRALEIKKTAPNNFEFGNPWIQEGREPNTFADPSTPSPDNGTTHLAVIDGDGNAVSITNTIMSGFGSGIIPKGTGVNNVAKVNPSSDTPAFANANTGIMPKAT